MSQSLAINLWYSKQRGSIKDREIAKSANQVLKVVKLFIYTKKISGCLIDADGGFSHKSSKTIGA
jgi:hypothetical protein